MSYRKNFYKFQLVCKKSNQDVRDGRYFKQELFGLPFLPEGSVVTCQSIHVRCTPAFDITGDGEFLQVSLPGHVINRLNGLGEQDPILVQQYVRASDSFILGTEVTRTILTAPFTSVFYVKLSDEQDLAFDFDPVNGTFIVVAIDVDIQIDQETRARVAANADLP